MSSHWISALARLDAKGTPAVMITVVDDMKSFLPRVMRAPRCCSAATRESAHE
ncbi:MAG: hypothetical protein ACJAWL_003197 [Motiliproteus sp.]|jgi:hypothetical protein